MLTAELDGGHPEARSVPSEAGPLQTLMAADQPLRQPRFGNRLEFEGALRQVLLTLRPPYRHREVAERLAISDRTFYRLRERHGIPWPPPADFGALAPEAEETTWFVQYIERRTLWVHAATAEEAIAKAREQAGQHIRIVSIQSA